MIRMHDYIIYALTNVLYISKLRKNFISIETFNKKRLKMLFERWSDAY